MTKILIGLFLGANIGMVVLALVLAGKDGHNE